MKTSTLVSFFGCLCVSVVSIAAETQDSKDASADSALRLIVAKRNVAIFEHGMQILQSYHRAGELLREEVPLDFKTLSSLTPVFEDYKSLKTKAKKMRKSYNETILKLNAGIVPLERRLGELMGQKPHRRLKQILFQAWCRQWGTQNQCGLRTPRIVLFHAGVDDEKLKEARKVYEKEFQEYVEKRRTARLKYLEEIAEVLPDEKRTKLKELIGDPIDWQDPSHK